MLYQINNISTIDDVLTLSKEVFSPSKEDYQKYHDKEDWLNKIQNDGLLISVKDNNNYIAFAICYKKEDKTLHIWNVGVREDYRGRGIWKKIYQKILDYALEKGYKHLTLNTYKDKFPNMYRFVKKENFTLVNEKTTTNGDVKSCFSKNL